MTQYEPITPAIALAGRSLPAVAVEAINEVIKLSLRGSGANVVARFTQALVAERIAKAMDCTTEYVFGQGWLDFEDQYRKAGWVVEYDKPGSGETFEAYFELRPKQWPQPASVTG